MITNKTEIVVILDRSGSMETIKRDVEGGFKVFIDSQKTIPGECGVTLIQFDTEYETVYENKPVNEVMGINIVPRGGTALIDAACKAIDCVGARFAKMEERDRPTCVIVYLISDGDENSSVEFKKDQLKGRIDEQTNKYNWRFIFLGTNFDAITAGKSYGVAAGTTLNFNSSSLGITGAFCAATGAATYYRTSVQDCSGYSFSAAERAAALS